MFVLDGDAHVFAERAWTWNDGIVTVRVPRLDIHAALVIEGGA